MSAISAVSRIAFVTEGGPDVGLGHLSRCAALARAAAADGARASFLVCEDAHVASLLRDVPAEVLRVPWQVDPARALRTLSGLAPDAIVSIPTRRRPTSSLRSVGWRRSWRWTTWPIGRFRWTWS